MSKFNNKTLLLILIILVVVWVGRTFIFVKGERNFESKLVTIDATTIDKIIIDQKNEEHPIIFSKMANDWQVDQNGISDEASNSGIQNILRQFDLFKVERLVSRDKSNWSKYEVDELLGTRVRAFNGDRLLTDIYIGKLNFQPNSRKSLTFVRLTDQDDIYAISGTFSSYFNTDFQKFRDPTFIQTNKANLTEIQFIYPADTGFVASRKESRWEINDAQTDSIAMETFLAGLGNLTKEDFVDSFDESDNAPIYQIIVKGNNMLPLTVKAFAVEADTILYSSLNENAYFQKGSLDIYQKLFISKGQLLPQ